MFLTLFCLFLVHYVLQHLGCLLTGAEPAGFRWQFYLTLDIFAINYIWYISGLLPGLASWSRSDSLICSWVRSEAFSGKLSLHCLKTLPSSFLFKPSGSLFHNWNDLTANNFSCFCWKTRWRSVIGLYQVDPYRPWYSGLLQWCPENFACQTRYGDIHSA